MSIKAKAVNTLYKAKRIEIEAVRQAVVNGLITEIEFKMIVGYDYN